MDLEDDINAVTAYFSYEHFYVLYCKFWELDVSETEAGIEGARDRWGERERERERLCWSPCCAENPPSCLASDTGRYFSSTFPTRHCFIPPLSLLDPPLCLQGDHDFLLSRSDLSRMSELTSVLLDRECGSASIWSELAASAE